MRARCAPAFPTNSGMHRVNSQGKEWMVALGAGGYSRAAGGMMTQIAKHSRDIGTFNTQLGPLASPISTPMACPLCLSS